MAVPLVVIDLRSCEGIVRVPFPADLFYFSAVPEHPVYIGPDQPRRGPLPAFRSFCQHLLHFRFSQSLRRIPSSFVLFPRVSFFCHVFRHSGQPVFIRYNFPDGVPGAELPAAFHGVPVHRSVHDDVMVPSDFCILVVLRYVDIPRRRQSSLFSLVVDPLHVFLHVADRFLHCFRQVLFVICQRDPKVALFKIGIDQPFECLPGVPLVQVPLCRAVIFPRFSSFRRDVRPSSKFREDLDFQLCPCPDLLQSVYTPGRRLPDLFLRQLFPVCLFVVIRDVFFSFHGFMSFPFSSTCYYRITRTEGVLFSSCCAPVPGGV